MRIKQFITLAVIAVFCFSSFQAYTQEEKPQPQLYVVWDIPVSPSMESEFDANAIKEVELFTKYKFPYSWDVFSTGDYHYFYVIHLENFADMDKLHQAFSDIRKAAGDEYKELSEGYLGTYEMYNMRFFWFMPELSYQPENLVEGYDDFMFREWNFAYLKMGKSQEFQEICKEWIALNKKYGLDRPYYMFQGDIGMDQPMFFWTMSAKSFAEYYDFNQKHNEISGEESHPLWLKTMDLVRKYETKQGFLRKSLSYKVAEE